MIPGAINGTYSVTALFTIRQRMTNMQNLIARFVRDDEGQDLIEYGLLIGIITVGAIAAILAIGPKVQSYFEDLNSALP